MTKLYARYGHLKDVFVKIGDSVKMGQKIGTVGNGNGQYVNSSHLHLDIPKKRLSNWTQYVFGMTKEDVKSLYSDPKRYRSIVAPWFDHFGWEYLEWAKYGSKYCYHPGEDLNGKGSGDSDNGLPIYSAFSGKVVYCYDGAGKNGGWGKLLVVEDSVTKTEPAKVETVSGDVKWTSPTTVEPLTTPKAIPDVPSTTQNPPEGHQNVPQDDSTLNQIPSETSSTGTPSSGLVVLPPKKTLSDYLFDCIKSILSWIKSKK